MSRETKVDHIQICTNYWGKHGERVTEIAGVTCNGRRPRCQIGCFEAALLSWLGSHPAAGRGHCFSLLHRTKLRQHPWWLHLEKRFLKKAFKQADCQQPSACPAAAAASHKQQRALWRHLSDLSQLSCVLTEVRLPHTGHKVWVPTLWHGELLLFFFSLTVKLHFHLRKNWLRNPQEVITVNVHWIATTRNRRLSSGDRKVYTAGRYMCI